MKLTVEATDGVLVARLDGYRPGVLDADRAADLFFDAVLKALQPGEHVDEVAATVLPVPVVVPAEADGAAAEPVVVPTVAEQVRTLAQQLADARPEALRRLDYGQDVAEVARALDVPIAIVRRWDHDPTWAAS